MRLRRLELRNFRQHQRSTIEFGPGMTAIVGPNGAGKSTILEAITFALYGEYRSSRETLTFMWPDGDDKKMSVLLEFELGHRVMRIERKENTAFLKEVIEDAETIRASQIRPVTAEVTRLLGLNYEQFKNSFCAEQKSLAFLDGKASETHREIARMLGFDRLKVAEDRAKEEARFQKRLGGPLEDSVASKPAKLRAQADARAARDAKQAELSKSESDLQALVVREAEVTRGRELAAKWRAQHEDLISLREQGKAADLRVKEAEKNLEAAGARVAERDHLLPQAKAYEDADRAHQEWESKRRQDAERQDKQTQLTTKRELLAQRRPSAPIDLGPLETAVRTALDASNAAAKAFDDAETDHRNAQREADRALAECESSAKNARTRHAHALKLVAEGKCPECEQPIGASFEIKLATLASDVETTEAALDAARKRVEALVRRPQGLIDLERNRNETRQAYADAQGAHERAKATAEEQVRQAELDAALAREIESLDQWLGDHPATYDAAAHAAVLATREALDSVVRQFLALTDAPDRLAECEKRRDALHQEFADLKAQHDALKKQQESLGITDKAEAEKLADEYSVWSTQREAQATLVETHRSDLRARESALAELERDIAKIEDDEKKLAETRRDQIHLDATSVQMGRLRESLNAQLKPDLEARASSHLAALTDGRYPNLTLNDDFQPQVQDGARVKAVLSGGEDDVVALAMRMALSELIQERHGDPLTLLILDEVFGSLDADRRSHLLDRLSALRGRFEQVLIISHIEEINEVADRCLYVSRNPRTRSAIVSDLPPEGLLVSALAGGL